MKVQIICLLLIVSVLGPLAQAQPSGGNRNKEPSFTAEPTSSVEFENTQVEPKSELSCRVLVKIEPPEPRRVYRTVRDSNWAGASRVSFNLLANGLAAVGEVDAWADTDTANAGGAFDTRESVHKITLRVLHNQLARARSYFLADAEWGFRANWNDGQGHLKLGVDVQASASCCHDDEEKLLVYGELRVEASPTSSGRVIIVSTPGGQGVDVSHPIPGTNRLEGEKSVNDYGSAVEYRLRDTLVVKSKMLSDGVFSALNVIALPTGAAAKVETSWVEACARLQLRCAHGPGRAFAIPFQWGNAPTEDS